MSVLATKVTVDTTATPICAGPRNGIHGGDVWVEVYNASDATVYVGGEDVTIATGRPVPAGRSFSFILQHGDDLYAVVASGDEDVYVFRGRQ